MNNEISLQQAIDMTQRFREQNESGGKIVLPNSETFDREAFDAVLKQTGCVKLRIYSGLTIDNQFRSIIVGVNEKDEDILPDASASATDVEGKTIIEEGTVCPPMCPPSSPLNP